MVPNLRQKVWLIAALVLASLLLLTLKDPPFRRGLDIAGGERYTLRFDYQEAIDSGKVSADENLDDLQQQTIKILYDRVDPTGLKEPLIRPEGLERVIIELPGETGLSGNAATSELAEPLPVDQTFAIRLVGQDASAFPRSGGVVEVGTEKIRYSRVDGNELVIAERPYQKTNLADHAAGEAVTLVSDDAIRNAILNLGELQFMIVAEASDFTGSGTDLAAQQQLLDDWLEANPGADLESFNRIPPESGGPSALIRWYAWREQENDQGVRYTPPPSPLLVPDKPEWEFSGDMLGVVTSRPVGGRPSQPPPRCEAVM